MVATTKMTRNFQVTVPKAAREDSGRDPRVSPEWSSEQVASRSKAPTIFLCSFIAVLQGMVGQNRAIALPHGWGTGARILPHAVSFPLHTAQVLTDAIARVPIALV